MKSNTILAYLKQWLNLKRKKPVDNVLAEPSSQAELFSVDQMERYGKRLAMSHTLTEKRSPDSLLNRLTNSKDTLIKACRTLTRSTLTHNHITPAGEWLLDNFYLIEEHIRTVGRHLPKGYGRGLPQLAGSLSQGHPRIYDITLQVIEHSDGRWDLENLTRFVASYQCVTTLTLGELWAIPIMLRLAIIENLSRTSARIATDWIDRHLAAQWAERMIDVAMEDPKKVVLVIVDMAHSNPPKSGAFVAELTRRLQGAALAFPLTWIEQHLTEEGQTIEQIIQTENKQQATNQVSISNGIASLRRLGEVDWRIFVETLSAVHHTLLMDPAAVYSNMDCDTRDRYCHVIEQLARDSFRLETEVATQAILLAKAAVNHSTGSNNTHFDFTRRNHVGFYLIGKGLPQLEQTLGLRPTLLKKLCQTSRQLPILGYLGFIALLTFGLTGFLLVTASQQGLPGGWLILLGLAVVLGSSQLAVALVNWAATLLVKPKLLPRMDFTKGIPPECRTLVVVPTMLVDAAGIQALARALEIRFLGNRDANLHFALLTDFNDAEQEHTPNDANLLRVAEESISLLNQRYPSENGDIFFLLHRPRRWNAQERLWMGYERKRGKLNDLNALLRGGNPQEYFSLISGRIAVLANIKYVITLDSDTQLPRESACKIVAAMAHPLNRPHFDEVSQRVIDGYGILQLRIVETWPSPASSRYLRLFGGEAGLDPYTRAVSDIYQDLFAEGSFWGKGIYDVDLFQHVLEKRLPDNRILSHDLLEGCYLRSGFLSDVLLYEKSPNNYRADVKRRARWIRGDWQLASWLLPRVVNKEGSREANPLSLLSKWKLLDNLRRSLAPIALLSLLVLGWAVLSKSSFWFEIVVVIVLLPALVGTLIELISKPMDRLHRQHLIVTKQSVYRHLQQLICYFTFLPHEAWYSLVAIVRTCWRLNVSHRHLLEWTPSDQVDSSFRDTLTAWILNLWVGPVLAIVMGGFLWMNRPWSLLSAMPLLILWLASPLIARWLSRPLKPATSKLAAKHRHFLHGLSRKTWAFFETFVTAEDNWLPLDNYQETPVEILAHRTSPTNIGMALLANLTAYDFGYITVSQLLDRTANTLQTMARLEHYHGHLYNWYNTQTLEPLYPRYISSVDSGNLAGHLLTLRQGLLALCNDSLLNRRYLDGLQDTLDVLVEQMDPRKDEDFIRDFQQLLRAAPSSLATISAAVTCSHALCAAAEKIADNVKHEWSQKLLLQCHAVRDEFVLLAESGVSVANVNLHDIALLATSNSEVTKDQVEAYQWAKARMALIETLAAEAFAMAQMDVSFLYDQVSHLMTIGFNVETQQADKSYYDLLASEARLGSFVAIAQGQAPQKSWSSLGRLLMKNEDVPILMSWSGSMFEYLMPSLVMPSYPDTLLENTCQAAVRRQIEYGKQRQVPWGISESGFNAVDSHYNYQYRAFGVPGLGFKRGLDEDLVVAPYASVMALMVAPTAACLNLQRLATQGMAGKFGFYEAIDFTATRVPPGETAALVRSFMAHHQGMSLLALSYLLNNQPMQRRFTAEPIFQATLLLLQERQPKPVAAYFQMPVTTHAVTVTSREQPWMRVFHNPNTRTPQVQMLSNGRYHVMLSQAGSGYSRWKDIAVTRWREDSTSDSWGLFSYLRDVKTGEFWSTCYQPTAGSSENFKAVFSEAHAEFRRSDHKIDIHTEIVVSPEDDIELRRLRMRNRSRIQRTIEFTSYAEVVLAPQISDQMQPAFNNLFVETEILSQQHAILATRRPRSEDESRAWMCHLLNVYSEESYQPLSFGSFSFETDRSCFIGRGRTLRAPLAMTEPGNLSGTAGPVLDPIVAIRCRVTLEPGASVTFDLVTGVTDNRDHCLTLIEKYHDRYLANRIFALAWTHGQVLLHQLNISEADVQLYGRLAGPIIYANNSRRAPPDILVSNRRGQSGLWGYSISGDLPIVLLHIEESANIEIIRQLIQAQAYWRHKGLLVDLVILNEERVSYRQSLQEQIISLIASVTVADHAGGIFVRVAEQVPLEDRLLIQSIARVVLSDKRGSLEEQLSRRRIIPPAMPPLTVSKSGRFFGPHTLAPRPSDLHFFNGLGGFTADGKEYLIRLSNEETTPAPWVNVLANPFFGTLVSECGQGYTWTENAHEFRLTPWDNDPLQDSAGEAFYIRDEETGQFWSPTALPCRGQGDYEIRHGFGYSVFEHVEEGIHSELWIYVAPDASVKFSVLKVRNDSIRRRHLSTTGYVEWVLGDLRSKNAMHVITTMSDHGALLAQNHYNTEFGERTAFFDATTSRSGLTQRTYTGDRAEFLGRNGTRQQPDALQRLRLSGHVGAGLDPCGAIQLAFDLAPGQMREIVFTLGVGRDSNDANALAQRYHGTMAAEAALLAVCQYWQKTLAVVQITTPDPAVDLLANGWLLYQILSSRLWGRSGYYQSGGAFGFRDQLQDVMALVHAGPQLFRTQLLLCAAHQFVEGDVQHWWHPPQDRGVRTRCSDDFLWLPLAICHYIETTGDTAVLDEVVPCLQGRPLNPDEESYYDLPTIGSESISLYQHAVRAIQNGLQTGVHGLPLIGSGDWNDGMNLVGEHGQGESIWLGFFLYDVLKRFAPLAHNRGDTEFAEHCVTHSTQLQQHLELNGWDGAWYRRAYFDDGTPLGSADNTECRIDSLAQSWAVLSGAADSARAQQAMSALNQYLVKREDGLVKLLDPPFDKTTHNPGYIKGYVPGVRENGGQYTHAAVWAAMAFARLGETQLAWQLLNVINPINHGRTPAEIAVYKIEPYVVAGDVYSVAPHIGRGGWSWYTGSAGWMYRLITESLLGIQLIAGNQLRLSPNLPVGWDSFKVDYRFGETLYQIVISSIVGKTGVTLDGVELTGEVIPLVDDQQVHQVTVAIARSDQ